MKSLFPFAAIAVVFSFASAITLDVDDPVSIKAAARTVSYDLMKYYTGNITNTPTTLGVLAPVGNPYYWWEAGSLWGTMLNYFHLTGDTTYNDVVSQALLSQVGPSNDYMVPQQQFDEGNDDQLFWGMSTILAAEQNFTQPATGGYTWSQLTENLWNTVASRWDESNCGGGFRWQIFASNKGYGYKNSVSAGAFFQISARLARFTGNSTYVDWAEKAYNWSSDIGFVTPNYEVYDGAGIGQNCSEINKVTWTYNLAIYLYGSAVMYNLTNGSALWGDRTQGLLNASSAFFSPFDNSTNIMYESACETGGTCDNDQFSFKAYLARFMWGATQLASFTTDTVTKLLTASAQAAAQACAGEANGTACGTTWYEGGYDGITGVGQQMSALEVIAGLLVGDAVPPLRNGVVHLATPTTAEPKVTGMSPKRRNFGTKTNKRSDSVLLTVCILAVRFLL